MFLLEMYFFNWKKSDTPLNLNPTVKFINYIYRMT